MTFDVLELSPRHYLREEIEVLNPLDDKPESWELNFLLPGYMFSHDEWVLEEGASVFLWERESKTSLQCIFSIHG